MSFKKGFSRGRCQEIPVYDLALQDDGPELGLMGQLADIAGDAAGQAVNFADG